MGQLDKIPEPGPPKWNTAINNSISYTSIHPAMAWQYGFWAKGLLFLYKQTALLVTFSEYLLQNALKMAELCCLYSTWSLWAAACTPLLFPTNLLSGSFVNCQCGSLLAKSKKVVCHQKTGKKRGGAREREISGYLSLCNTHTTMLFSIHDNKFFTLPSLSNANIPTTDIWANCNHTACSILCKDSISLYEK